ASLRGNVMGSLALGFTLPKRTLATASSPLLQAYQASRTQPTLSIHGMRTAVPVSSTTTVRGLAAATCSINASWFSGRERLGRSVPSLIHSYANTIATSHFAASAAAAAGSAPESKATWAPGAAARTAFRGEVGNHTCDCQGWAGSPGGSTCADPPPEIMPVSALGPITAMERTLL